MRLIARFVASDCNLYAVQLQGLWSDVEVIGEI